MKENLAFSLHLKENKKMDENVIDRFLIIF